MNRYVKAGMDLAVAQRELGTLLDTPAEKRESDFEGKLTDAKDVVRAAQSAVEVAALAEPSVAEHRQDSNGGAELRSMMDRANLGEMFDKLVGHGIPDGPMAELQQHFNLQGNQVPLAMLETRAVTPAPSDVGQQQQAIIPYIFPQAAAAFLGVDMPTVGVGEVIFPVLTSALTVGTPAENAAQAETTGSFTADVLSPSRIQAAFFYSREDRARFAGMDAALWENLSAGLSDGLDDQILSGTNGLFAGTNLTANAQTTDDTFDTYLSNLVWNQIDGRYAAMASDLAMVVGAATYKDLGATYRNTSVDRSALDRIMELVSGIRVSAHVPAPASNRQDVVIRRGSSRNAVAPIWEGISIIPDEITLAAEGQLKITAVMLYAMKVLRTDAGLIRQGTDHS